MAPVTRPEYDLSCEAFVQVLQPRIPSPVVISVPHDGIEYSQFQGLTEKRSTGFCGPDDNTWHLARLIALEVSINVVRGLLPRDIVDYNRASEDHGLVSNQKAYEDNAFAFSYRHFHDTLKSVMESGTKIFGAQRMLLIDLHGFTEQPSYAPASGYDVVLGTGNRSTIQPGSEIDRTVANLFQRSGYSVFLPEETTVVAGKKDRYNGGFICRYHSKSGFNVLQVEVSRPRRNLSDGSIERLANVFAKVLAHFL